MNSADFKEAIAKGDEYMARAYDAFEKAEGPHVRLEAVAVDLARASYLQTRALAFYQRAAIEQAQPVSEPESA